MDNKKLNTMKFDGKLGSVYSKEKTIFRLWTPVASEVTLNLYKKDLGDNLIKSHKMTQEKGVFEYTVDGDNHGVYYDFTVTVNKKTNTVHDPYAIASGANSVRSMVIDLEKTNPVGWEKDGYINPKETKVPQTDAIIYELHVRDLSINKNANIKNAGKYLAFTELNTKSDKGELTGLSHIKELGVNYIHLLPVYDYNSVDEIKCDGFNWGYDPINYSVPEGSYSTNASDGVVRINEFKQMVMAIHEQKIGVIMDVVYNHTAKSQDSHFNLIVPNYYYRTDKKGKFTDGSGCGNEVASDNEMVRKYIIESCVYWAKEYHIDGFRFDLMAVLDIKTMNDIRKALDEINPNIVIYGEGWNGGGSSLDPKLQASKKNTKLLDNRIACFSDDVRDGIKGDVFIEEIPGYINDEGSTKEAVIFGITASTQDVGELEAWANEPTQVVTYVSAHDNYTLHDKIQLSVKKGTTTEDIIAMNNLASAIVLTSQGMAFIHAGEELLRTKPLKDGYDENSYKSPDSVNMFDWDRKSEHKDIFNYYKGLIELRKTFPEFRYSTAKEIKENIKFVETKNNLIIYTLANKFVVMFNPYNLEVVQELPAGNYQYYVDKTKAGATLFGETVTNKIHLQPLSAIVLGKI